MNTSNKTNFFSALWNKRNSDHKKFSNFLGAFFIMISYGGINLWGNFILYFCSYYYEQDNLLPKDTGLTISLVALPSTCLLLFSVQLAEKFGFKRLISTALIFPICVILSAFVGYNIYIFLAFYFFIPILIFSLTLNPILYSVWSYAPEIKGKLSGYLFGMLQLSMIFYIIVGTYIINPNNVPPRIKIEGTETLLYNNKVTENLQNTLFFFGFTSLSCGIIGVYFIQNPFKEAEIKSNLINEKTSKKEEKNKNEDVLDDENKIENSKIKNLSMEKFFQAEDLIDRLELLNKSKEGFSNECPDLKTGIKSAPFIILFINSFLISLCPIFLNLNYKDISIRIFLDDYLTTWLYIINLMVSSIGRFLWGYLVDKFPFKNIIITLNILAIIAGLTLPFMQNSVLFSIFYLSFSFFDGGVMSVIGPGLLHIFGLNIGAKLLGVKGISFIFSLMLIPILSHTLINSLEIKYILLLLGAVNVIGLILCLFLKKDYKWKNESLREQLEIN